MVGHSKQSTQDDGARRITYRWLTLGLIGFVAILVLSTFNQYGMSWDEYYRFKSGDAKLNYYKQLLAGQEAIAGVDHYPGLFDLTLAAIHPYFPWSRITTGHFMSSLFGIAAIVGVALTGKMLGGWSAAFWAVLFLITLPRFYGHIFFNPKDIPFAATYIWGLFFLLKYLKQLDVRQSLGEEGTSKATGPSWKTAIGLGVAFGTCMSMRIGGLILFCYLGMALVIAFSFAVISQKHTLTSIKKLLNTIVPQLLVAGIIASLVLLFWWPHAHANFFKATANTLGKITTWQASSSGTWQLHVLFDGDYYKDIDLPNYYWPWMFCISTPIFHLLLVIGGIVFSTIFFSRKLREIKSINNALLSQFIIVFAALFPVAYVVIRDATVFDGIRHLLFVLTPLAVCVGILITRGVRSHEPGARRLIEITLFILLTLPAWSMVQLHPYQYTFYNILVGGTAGASSHYETDYWGTSNRAAIEALVAHLKQTDPQFSKSTYLISSSNGSWLSSRYFPDNFKFTAQRELADFYIGNTRLHGHELIDGNTILEITADTTLVCVVKDRRAQKKTLVRQLLDARIKERGLKVH